MNDGNDTNSLFTEILQTLTERKKWSDRNDLFYEMRHNGLRRKRLPFPGAADLHYPMADSMIEKHKPFYYQLLFAQDLVAMFQSLAIERQADCQSIAHWFDYKLKQKSNTETEILVAIDFMLMCGRSVMKTIYDTTSKRLKKSGIDPVFFVVPPYTESLEEADYMCEIKQFSVNQYKRLGSKWNQDPAFIKKISGASSYQSDKLQLKYRREGINIPNDDTQIIIWEVYNRVSDGWTVSWFSPSCPDTPARPTQKLVAPYKAPPYVDFVTEIKDKGWYSPRGIPEIVATFEAYITKMLNENADYMTFVNRPIYTSDGQIVNMQNYKFTPGQYVPNGLRKVEQSPPPMSFQQEEMNIRAIAEYRVGMPDFGLGSRGDPKSKDTTATEVNAITSLMGQSVDLRVRLFRNSLGKMFAQDWELLRYYEKDSLEFFYRDQMKKIDPLLLEGDYTIEPTGSSDNMNRQFIMQKAVMRRQMFLGVPWINQQELDKSVLEADDPRLIARLMIDPNEPANEQAEEQADEIGNMQIGFPVKLSASDDDMVHLLTLIQFIQSVMAKKVRLAPDFAALLKQHGMEHFQRLGSSPQGKAKLKQLNEGVMGAAIGFLTAMIGQGAPQQEMQQQGTPPQPEVPQMPQAPEQALSAEAAAPQGGMQ